MRITLPSGKWRKRLKIKALPPFAELHKVRAGNYKMFNAKFIGYVNMRELLENGVWCGQDTIEERQKAVLIKPA